MIQYKESFRFSNDCADYAITASAFERSPGVGNGIMLVFDVLSKPRGYSQNRVFEIKNGNYENGRNVGRLVRRLLDEIYGYSPSREAERMRP